MLELTDKQMIDYFRRSYMAVDGLWFVKLEESDGFDHALDVDIDVWKIMPKIQARKMKAMVNVPPGINGLFECFTKKLDMEGFIFQTQKGQKEFEITVSHCPWYDIILKSGRQHLAEKIGSKICTTEYGGWAAEFGNIKFELISRHCNGDCCCRFRFTEPIT